MTVREVLFVAAIAVVAGCATGGGRDQAARISDLEADVSDAYAEVETLRDRVDETQEDIDELFARVKMLETRGRTQAAAVGNVGAGR